MSELVAVIGIGAATAALLIGGVLVRHGLWMLTISDEEFQQAVKPGEAEAQDIVECATSKE